MTTTTATQTAASGNSIASQDMLALAARILLAAIFILSGFAKLGAAEGTIGYIASVGMPFPEAVYFATVALELIGGVALVLGFKTRLVAFALAGFSIAAAVIFHADFGDQSQFTSFLKNLAIAGGMLQVAAFGPGRLSLDRK